MRSSLYVIVRIWEISFFFETVRNPHNPPSISVLLGLTPRGAGKNRRVRLSMGHHGSSIFIRFRGVCHRSFFGSGPSGGIFPGRLSLLQVGLADLFQDQRALGVILPLGGTTSFSSFLGLSLLDFRNRFLVDPLRFNHRATCEILPRRRASFLLSSLLFFLHQVVFSFSG